MRTGAAISARVLQSDLMREKMVFGIYIHAERLREVDTTSILQRFVPPAGKCHPEASQSLLLSGRALSSKVVQAVSDQIIDAM